jgi:amidase
MKTSEYQDYDGVGLAGLLERREVTPVELMQCAIELARDRGAKLNALCYERYDESLALAEGWAQKGVFRGIPFLLKDSSLAAKRFPASVGSRLFKDLAFSYDATLTERFDAAGLIPFSRTTVPEFCMAPTTEAKINGGPALNPWDLARTTGGSSGGAAAALAARIVPIAHGSDGGGSIRIPAASCGVFGLKASRGVVPAGPSKGEIWGGLGTDGVLSLSVRDSAMAMDAIGGGEAGAPYAAPARTGGYAQALSAKIPAQRIALWKSAWTGVDMAPECAAAAEHAGRLLQSLGHEVAESPLMDWDYEAFVQAHYTVLCAQVVASTDARPGGAGPILAGRRSGKRAARCLSPRPVDYRRALHRGDQ